MKDLGLNIYYGFLHVLVCITSIIFVTTTIGLNLPLAFLSVAMGIIVFRLMTKAKLPAVLGVSGAYVSGMIAVGTTHGAGFVAGGVILSGIIYLIFGFLMKKFPRVMSLFPNYILSLAIICISLTLIPIGIDVFKANPIIGAITILCAMIIQAIPKLSMLTMPIALGVGTLAQWWMFGLESSNQATELLFTTPQFNLYSFSLIGVVALAVIFETIADTRNMAIASGVDIDSEVGLHRVVMGNGIATVISGAMGGQPLTTYSENTGFLYLTKWTNPNAQIFTALIFVAMAFIPQIPQLIGYIPMASFGAILVYLFSLILVSNIKELELKDEKMSRVATITVALFFIAPEVVPQVSPIAVAMLGAVIVNKLIKGGASDGDSK